jgi:hypothetical protein
LRPYDHEERGQAQTRKLAESSPQAHEFFLPDSGLATSIATGCAAIQHLTTDTGVSPSILLGRWADQVARQWILMKIKMF